MFTKLIDTIIVKLTGGSERQPEAIDWKSVVSKIEPHIESHSIFLEKRNGSFVLPEQLNQGEQVISVIVAYAQKGINPWETEAPAKYMAEKLSGILGIELPYLLSRNPELYAGFYVCVRT
jgi:hypothetical protein